jgi:hypothetical protein
LGTAQRLLLEAAVYNEWRLLTVLVFFLLFTKHFDAGRNITQGMHLVLVWSHAEALHVQQSSYFY